MFLNTIYQRIVMVTMLLAAISMNVNSESLYSESTFESLVSDHRGISVGDAITVLIVENSRARSQTNASLNESIGLSGSVGQTNQTELGSVDIGVGRNSGGLTQREGQMDARITVIVEKIDEAGNLFVKGEQKLVVNGEEQRIKAEGWLRKEDIGANNVAISTRLANANIEYSGFGYGSDTEKPGFLHWLMSKIGLI
mgnify:CR=1 FL=1